MHTTLSQSSPLVGWECWSLCQECWSPCQQTLDWCSVSEIKISPWTDSFSGFSVDGFDQPGVKKVPLLLCLSHMVNLSKHTSCTKTKHTTHRGHIPCERQGTNSERCCAAQWLELWSERDSLTALHSDNSRGSTPGILLMRYFSCSELLFKRSQCNIPKLAGFKVELLMLWGSCKCRQPVISLCEMDWMRSSNIH